jgi:xanthine dehydrogenase YagS FAD-binding subunit
MKGFEYTRAKSVRDAIGAHGGEGVRYLAGGTNLIDLMKYDVEDAKRLIDISRLPLNRIEDLPEGGVRIGALVKNSDLASEPKIVQSYPVLSQALLSGASPQLRNMATTGGNLLQRTRCYYFYDTALPCNKRTPGSGCGAIEGMNRIHAVLGHSEHCIAVHPSDMAVAMAMLDAVVLVDGPKGRRSIPVLDLHRLPGAEPQFDTTLQPGELIVAVELPAFSVAKNSHYVKVRDRAEYAFALTSAAVALELQGALIKEARLALGGVAHKPWRSKEAEKSLVGKTVTKENFREAAEIALTGAQGFKYNEFKIELAKRTVVRAFEELGGGMA